MLLLSYGEVIPMCATRKYTATELLDECVKRKIKYEFLTQGPLPHYVFLRYEDGEKEHVTEARLLSTCEAVARHHDMLRSSSFELIE
jgi:hypothetical protein